MSIYNSGDEQGIEMPVDDVDGPADCARRVIGCHSSQKTRVQNLEVAGYIAGRRLKQETKLWVQLKCGR
jgi:hypothetical protein